MCARGAENQGVGRGVRIVPGAVASLAHATGTTFHTGAGAALVCTIL